MLTQLEANDLISILKELQEKSDNIIFPTLGNSLALECKSPTTKDKFIIDVNRKGTLKITKCTYQTRYKNSLRLVRIDLDGPPHENPDGNVIECPHIHIFREGFELKWAYPLSEYISSDPTDLISILIDFLRYNNVSNIKNYKIHGGGLI